MSSLVPVLNNDALARSQNKARFELAWNLVASTGQNVANYIGTDVPQIIIIPGNSTLPTQAVVDSLLGTPNDVVVATAFGSTAMVANNTYGFILACDGQIREAGHVQVSLNIAGTVSSSVGVATVTPFANSAFTLTQLHVTPAGNLCGRINATAISTAATVGSVSIRFAVKTK